MVIGHFADYRSSSGLFQSVFLFAYSWHMPLFILLAGLFDRPRDAFPGGKVASYVVLGLLFKLVAFFVDLLLGYRSFWLLGDAGAPWFMFAIAGWIALAWLFRRMPFLPVLAASLVLSLAVGYDNGVGDYLYLSRIVALFPIYWVGFKLSSGDVLKTMQAAGFLSFPFSCSPVGALRALSRRRQFNSCAQCLHGETPIRFWKWEGVCSGVWLPMLWRGCLPPRISVSS